VPLLFKQMQDNILKKAGNRRSLLAALAKLNLHLRKININLAGLLFRSIHVEFGGQLRFMTSAAVALPISISEFFYGVGYPIFEGYGLTETSPVIAVNCYDNNIFGSVGKIMENQEVCIFQPDENGVGEIIVKGDNVTKSYYKDEKLNALYFDDKGFYHTEDLGYVDNKGYLWIVGRLKNIIVRLNGKRIYPEEMEASLCKFDEINECIIYEKNEKITAKVYSIYDCTAVQKAIDEFNRLLPNYKKIAEVEITDKPFEKISNIKVRRSGANEDS